MSHGFVAEFRNRSGTLQRRLEHEIDRASWRYDRIGGCGDFEISVRRDFPDFPGVGLDWDMRLYRASEVAPLNRAIQLTNSGGYGAVAWSVGSQQPVDSLLIHGHSVASGSSLRIQAGPVPQDFALTFTGSSNSHVTIADNATLRPTTFTLLAWTRANTFFANPSRCVTKIFQTGVRPAYVLHFGSNQRMEVVLQGLLPAPFEIIAASSVQNLLDGTWHRIGGRLKSSGELVALLDGVPASNTTSAAADYSISGGMFFGCFDDVDSFQRFRGDIDDVRLYGIALTDQEILDDYNGLTKETSLSGHWKFDEGQGLEAADASPNTNTGSLAPGVSWTPEVHSPVNEAIASNPITILHALTTSPRSYVNWRLIATSLRNNTGAISEVMGYQRTVSSAEAVRLETQQVTPDPINRLVHFPLNENAGTTANDAGPYGFNASIQGSVAWTGGNGSTISPGARTLDLWYRGYVSEIQETREALSGDVNVLRGHGYVGQMGRALITASYAATKAESVVGDIMLNRGVTSKTSIVFCGTNVDTTSVSVTDMQFRNTPADRAISQLADLVGTREWGVDRQAAFFFRARRDPATAPASAYETFISGKDLTNISITNRGDALINSVFVEGGVEQGKVIIVESVNSQSQVDYGRRETYVTAASFVNSTDAAQMGASIVAEKAAIRNEVTFESAAPTMVESRVLTGNTQGAPVISVLNASSRGNYLLAGVQYSIDAGRGFTSRVSAGEAIRSPAAYSAETSAFLELIRQRTLQDIQQLADAVVMTRTDQQCFSSALTVNFDSNTYISNNSLHVTGADGNYVRVQNPGLHKIDFAAIVYPGSGTFSSQFYAQVIGTFTPPRFYSEPGSFDSGNFSRLNISAVRNYTARGDTIQIEVGVSSSAGTIDFHVNSAVATIYRAAN